jgi:hypothetical protein
MRNYSKQRKTAKEIHSLAVNFIKGAPKNLTPFTLSPSGESWSEVLVENF